MSSQLETHVEEYVTAFRTSSDRARYALYFVMIATVLISIANYNVQEWSWPVRRLAAWYGYARTEPPPTTADATIPFFEGDALRLKDAREEYVKQFTSRAVFTSSPIPGVTIDINDIGLVGGLALCLLMLVQTLCVMREHENLFLALYKVFQLDRTLPAKPHARGDGAANLLYHALAMSQVISSPPTLARWENRGTLNHLNLIFFVPFVAFGWVFITNCLTIPRAHAYDVDVIPSLILQFTFLVELFILSLNTWLHSKAMADRWSRAFFHINPQLRVVRQPNEEDWLRWRWSWPYRAKQRHRSPEMMPQLLDSLVVTRPELFHARHVYAVVPIVSGIDGATFSKMSRSLKASALRAARTWCKSEDLKFKRLGHFRVVANVAIGSRWCVLGTWTFYYDPSARYRRTA